MNHPLQFAIALDMDGVIFRTTNERGTHAELLALDGRCADMWRVQQSSAEEPA